MSILNPTRGTIRAALVQHADMLASKAERLREYGESLDDFTDADFLQHIGDEYAGPGFVRQMLEEVAKASEVRPSDVFQIQYALFEVFGRAQRERAAAARPPAVTDGQGACQSHPDVHAFTDDCVGFHEVREVDAPAGSGEAVS